MRIASFISVILIALGAGSVFLAGKSLWSAHQLVLDEVRLADLAQARSEWYEGTVALSLERSVTQVALALDTPVPDAFRSLIDAQRQQSNALLDQSLRILAEMPEFSNREDFVARVGMIRSDIEGLRAEADGLLAQAGAERDAGRTYDLPYELKTEIEGLFMQAALLVLPKGLTSTEEMVLSRIQGLAWEVREFAGRARTFYAIATLTGQPIPDRMRGEAYIDTARAISAWERIGIEAGVVTLPADFVAAIEAADIPFAQTYLPVLDELDLAMDNFDPATPLPYSFEAFFEISNDGLGAVADLAPLAGEYIQAYWAEELASVRGDRLMGAVIVVLVVSLTVVTIFLVQRKVTRPIVAVTEVLGDMADGKYEREYSGRARNNLSELTVIWGTLLSLSERLIEAREIADREKEAEQRAKRGIISELVTALGNMAQGDLTHEIPDSYGEAYSELVENFNETSRKLRDVIGKVIETAEEISQNSDGLSDAVGDLSQRSEHQMRMISETAQSLKGMVQGLAETADNTKQSLMTISEATQKSDDGRAVVERAISAMDQIRATSDSISGFGTIIDDIAFQTNLLSLNAGVEAARAGEAGKGFAVVAQEVRNLAGQASSAAREVKEQVENSKISVESGVQEVTKTGQSLSEISDMVGAAKGRIDHVDSNSRDQAQTLGQIGQTMDEIDAISRQNAEMAVDAAHTSQSLKDRSNALRAAMAQFRIRSGARDRRPPMQAAE